MESNKQMSIESSKNEIDKDAAIQKMLKEFYSVYIKEFTNEKIAESERKLDSIEIKFCTKSLLDSISNEFEHNELDYNPFVKAQDASLDWIETLTVSRLSGSKNKFNVQYLDKYSGNATSIHVTVINEKGIFKISSLK
ncbi:DUF3828 domain-containing protein [Flavobacterium sp. ARAG 55.4]|uniref:DUF3828 domain-containing protein n=1 Tax=Flavobacterium sp. ARAG 55.4 TaxID=3451357 RepID=UPI003F480DFA